MPAWCVTPPICGLAAGTLLGEYPSLAIGPLLDTHRTEIGAIVRGALETERKALARYRELLKCAEGRSVILEEYTRQMVYAEELHTGEVHKMLRKPGEVSAFRPSHQSRKDAAAADQR